MTPNATFTAKVQRTVFDLTAFDDVTLVKTITLPNAPTSLEEALAAVGNDTERLMSVIHEGLVADAKEVARNDMSGFMIQPEEGEPTEIYAGKFADDAKGKRIGNAILALAKMNGYEKSLPKEEKSKLKERATAFLRDNPAMMSNLQD